jgi:hypothetical protein
MNNIAQLFSREKVVLRLLKPFLHMEENSQVMAISIAEKHCKCLAPNSEGNLTEYMIPSSLLFLEESARYNFFRLNNEVTKASLAVLKNLEKIEADTIKFEKNILSFSGYARRSLNFKTGDFIDVFMTTNLYDVKLGLVKTFPNMGGFYLTDEGLHIPQLGELIEEMHFSYLELNMTENGITFTFSTNPNKGIKLVEKKETEKKKFGGLSPSAQAVIDSLRERNGITISTPVEEPENYDEDGNDDNDFDGF